MVNTQRPKFCGTCGRPLSTSNRVLGYDVFSGEPLGEEKLTCPSTVPSRVIPFTQVSAGHASWVLNSNSDKWEIAS